MCHCRPEVRTPCCGPACCGNIPHGCTFCRHGGTFPETARPGVTVSAGRSKRGQIIAKAEAIGKLVPKLLRDSGGDGAPTRALKALVKELGRLLES